MCEASSASLLTSGCCLMLSRMLSVMEVWAPVPAPVPLGSMLSNFSSRLL